MDVSNVSQIATCGAICPNGNEGGMVTVDAIHKAVEALEDDLQKVSLFVVC